jgi:membrane protease YdiL (CAAX protease family)
MKPATYPILPHQPISFRTTYWLIFVGFASVVWASLSSHLGRNLEAREAMDPTNWHLWIDQRFTLKALLFRQGNWVLEELIFRGMLLQLLRRYCPLWLSLLLSAALFALIHLSKGPSTMTVAFVMSYYFAWLMMRTNSIYASIVAHWAIDFGTLYVAFPLLAATGRINSSGFSFPAWAWVLSAAVIIAGLGVLRREFHHAPARFTAPEAAA